MRSMELRFCFSPMGILKGCNVLVVLVTAVGRAAVRGGGLV